MRGPRTCSLGEEPRLSGLARTSVLAWRDLLSTPLPGAQTAVDRPSRDRPENSEHIDVRLGCCLLLHHNVMATDDSIPTQSVGHRRSQTLRKSQYI